MKTSFLIILLAMSNLSFATTLRIKLGADRVLGTQPEQKEFFEYFASEKNPFPFHQYTFNTIVLNPNFKHADEKDNVNLTNAQKIKIYGKLKLLSYKSSNNNYKFDLSLDQKVTLIKDRITNKPVTKDMSAKVFFTDSKNKSITLSDKFWHRKKVRESFPHKGNDDIRLTIDDANFLSTVVTKPITITIELYN